VIANRERKKTSRRRRRRFLRPFLFDIDLPVDFFPSRYDLLCMEKM